MYFIVKINVALYHVGYMILKGNIVALITPMKEQGAIDYQALAHLIEWHLAERTAGFVIAGSTGEAATLTPQERHQLLKFVIKQVKSRVPVIAGTGTPSTQMTIAFTQSAQTAGADACLIVTPYYNKPTQAGLYQHYAAIAKAVTLPLLLYNVPSRSGCDLLPETVEQLSHIKNIIGIKEASNHLERAKAIRAHCHQNFILLSGNDETAATWMLANLAQGVISVTANVVPKQTRALCEAALATDSTRTQMLQSTLLPLHQRLFIVSNPIPVKWVLSYMGKITNTLRLPLTPLEPSYHAMMIEALRAAGEVPKRS